MVRSVPFSPATTIDTMTQFSDEQEQQEPPEATYHLLPVGRLALVLVLVVMLGMPSVRHGLDRPWCRL